MTDKKIFFIESDGGPYQIILKNVMRMVPDRDKNDVALKRLIAFRLRTDGESATRGYLMRKIRDMIHCSFNGSLYEFLKKKEGDSSSSSDVPPSPPDIA